MKKWPRDDYDDDDSEEEEDKYDDEVNPDSTSERDLQLLNEMNIDGDFNVWSDFRDSFNAEKRQSLRVTRQSMKHGAINDSASSTSSAIIGAPLTNKRGSVESFCEDELERDKEKGKAQCDGNIYSERAFNKLSPAERADIQEWKKRLTREQVFSRYYFPEKWEMREMRAISDFLSLNEPGTKIFLNEPGRLTTKKAVSTIFNENSHDPKSVLLKRGPILYDGTEECELMLFTHGLLFSKVEFDALVNTLLSVNERNPALTRKELRVKFNAIDTDGSGSLDRLEMRDMFQSLGVPVSEQALSELMQKFDADGNDTITFDEFEAVALALEPKGEASPKKTFWKDLGATLKKAWNVAEDAKLDCAYLLSDIERIESLDVCNSEQTKIFANSSWAELCFSIFIKGRQEPIILVCSKPEQRAAWIDALGVCIVNSIRFQSDALDKKAMTSQLGWQHRRIRASISSLVLEEDLAGLQKQKVRPTPGVDINYRDPYHGYTALHYAVIMGNLEIAALLLSMSVMVNVKDKSDKTPLDHASLAKNSDMEKLLKENGGKKNVTEGLLFKTAVEEQKQKKVAKDSPASTVGNKANKLGGAMSAMSEAMSALRERGEKLERLDNKTAELHSEASNYAEMARKMKEKNRKKATNMFGL
mmetsp:Transcript_20959/g.44040  ORF Transcript_20959/g.44040 Transcript_20959/m.44040 type:complete len:646 (-) Transcript_20959:824-2761(-)|eukprot:CAMPEP_0171333998 /NCGR_PEP_ID=MMETSP0878-20121228/4376_1 /TAXON_ID=67004 /ORGANISM="Thalassiosira weissflogii, Strain CCMP1336" /LENGTH=645 /DNA_ID=CAMNT_0011835029 /DNA_START=76 /DNA_END=2013 /DNA_ORIENTATION=+